MSYDYPVPFIKYVRFLVIHYGGLSILAANVRLTLDVTSIQYDGISYVRRFRLLSRGVWDRKWQSSVNRATMVYFRIPLTVPSILDRLDVLIAFFEVSIMAECWFPPLQAFIINPFVDTIKLGRSSTFFVCLLPLKSYFFRFGSIFSMQNS